MDATDFQISDGKTIDIKTASKNYHTRILVPYDQYHNQRKDYCAGVRILSDEKTAEVMGFAAWEDLKPFGRGDYPAFAIGLNLLRPISTLLEMMFNTLRP